ncbi:Asp23/Gls24 family envelope stress response protein [Lentilactobacillus sp. SPB1-3]|uniref:Asp23/Gls24 family envelope stress response protein n=1 Tax=Lentilactobacillus terminaliae TaxID=3003483 RepID=A0ACD5DDW9_9LACO|nr:Asp23/Gls24 family envelope stress response protein [Lentilactobacillus sp. SPB1-3]MCZ0977469.1 Asp23/Gls24 family envelope stress response protein [Lentilactobacillus sp. SPB1-3]
MSNNTTTNMPETKMVFDDNVIAKITGKTACEVDGVLDLEGNVFEKMTDKLSSGDDPTAGVDVNMNEDDNRVELKINAILEYGRNAEQVFNKMSQKITNSVEEMTNMKVDKIDLTVQDMLTRDEWAKKNEPKSEKKRDKSDKHDHES